MNKYNVIYSADNQDYFGNTFNLQPWIVGYIGTRILVRSDTTTQFALTESGHRRDTFLVDNYKTPAVWNTYWPSYEGSRVWEESDFSVEKILLTK